MDPKVWARILQALLRLPVLDWVPSGYLTKAGAVLQVVAGVVLLLQEIVQSGISGEVPSLNSLDAIFGMFMLGNGAQGLGIRRRMGDS